MRRSNPPGADSRALVADRLRYLVGNQADRADLVEDVGIEPLPVPRFHRAHLGIVTVLVMVGLLAAGWALLRARPVPIPSPGAAVAVSTPAARTEPSSSARSGTPTTIVVHVAGAVRRPGLVQLGERSRVQDAIDAAGGLARDARPGQLNLAQVLTDGQQVLIGTARHPVTEVREGDGAPTANGAGTQMAAIDLNRATATQLEQLPGVGPVTAGNIVTWREQRGRFASVSELQQVDGIGPKIYARIAPHLRV